MALPTSQFDINRLTDVQEALRTTPLKDLMEYNQGKDPALVPPFMAAAELMRRKQIEDTSKAFYQSANQPPVMQQVAQALLNPTLQQVNPTQPQPMVNPGQPGPMVNPAQSQMVNPAQPAPMMNPTQPAALQQNVPQNQAMPAPGAQPGPGQGAQVMAEGGLAGLPVHMFHEDNYAGGGIVAFDDGGTVIDPRGNPNIAINPGQQLENKILFGPTTVPPPKTPDDTGTNLSPATERIQQNAAALAALHGLPPPPTVRELELAQGREDEKKFLAEEQGRRETAEERARKKAQEATDRATAERARREGEIQRQLNAMALRGVRPGVTAAGLMNYYYPSTQPAAPGPAAPAAPTATAPGAPSAPPAVTPPVTPPVAKPPASAIRPPAPGNTPTGPSPANNTVTTPVAGAQPNAQDNAGLPSIAQQPYLNMPTIGPAPTQAQADVDYRARLKEYGLDIDPYAEVKRRQADIEARQRNAREGFNNQALMAQLIAFGAADPTKGFGYAMGVGAQAAEAIRAKQAALVDQQEQSGLEFAKNMAAAEDARRRGDMKGASDAYTAAQKSHHDMLTAGAQIAQANAAIGRANVDIAGLPSAIAGRQAQQRLQEAQATAIPSEVELRRQQALAIPSEVKLREAQAAKYLAEAGDAKTAKLMAQVTNTIERDTFIKKMQDQQSMMDPATPEWWNAQKLIDDAKEQIYKQNNLPYTARMERPANIPLESPKKPGLMERIFGSSEKKPEVPAYRGSQPPTRFPNATKAPDGNWYIPNPMKPGAWMMVTE